MDFIELEQSRERVKLLVTNAEPWMSQTWWKMREDKECIEEKLTKVLVIKLNKNTLKLYNKAQWLNFQGLTSQTSCFSFKLDSHFTNY